VRATPRARAAVAEERHRGLWWKMAPPRRLHPPRLAGKAGRRRRKLCRKCRVRRLARRRRSRRKRRRRKTQTENPQSSGFTKHRCGPHFAQNGCGPVACACERFVSSRVHWRYNASFRVWTERAIASLRGGGKTQLLVVCGSMPFRRSNRSDCSCRQKVRTRTIHYNTRRELA
jgi:hypothetical protein